jgi:hypothetical protein
MPGHEDIRLTGERLEALYRDVRDEGLSVEEALVKVAEALTLYRSFKEHFSSTAFEVNVLARDAAGKSVERPFDRKALDV